MDKALNLFEQADSAELLNDGSQNLLCSDESAEISSAISLMWLPRRVP